MTRPCSLLACWVRVAIEAGADACPLGEPDEFDDDAGLVDDAELPPVEQAASRAASARAIPLKAALPDGRMCGLQSL
jgi:hypothetical protein